MIAANQYLYTNLPSGLKIGGGRLADGMCLTHEHWHFINELVRTYEMMGSLTPNRYYADFTGSTAKNAPLCMAPDCTVLNDWFNRCDTVRTAKIVMTKNPGLWTQGVEDHSASGCPSIGLPTINANLEFIQAGPITHPDGMAPSKSVLTNWANEFVYITQEGATYGKYSINVFDESPVTMGAFSHFFQTRNDHWLCNGSASSSPEQSTLLMQPPFWYDRSTTFGRTASTYFREVSDRSDLTFVREMNLGYELPPTPWPSASSSSYDSYVIFWILFGMMSCALWKGKSGTRYDGAYTWDQKRYYAIGVPDQMDAFGRGEINWNVLGASDVKTKMENALTRSEFDPSAKYTVPSIGSTSDFSRVGYHLYVWPAAIIARATPPHRDMGERIY